MNNRLLLFLLLGLLIMPFCGFSQLKSVVFKDRKFSEKLPSSEAFIVKIPAEKISSSETTMKAELLEVKMIYYKWKNKGTVPEEDQHTVIAKTISEDGYFELPVYYTLLPGQSYKFEFEFKVKPGEIPADDLNKIYKEATAQLFEKLEENNYLNSTEESQNISGYIQEAANSLGYRNYALQESVAIDDSFVDESINVTNKINSRSLNLGQAVVTYGYLKAFKNDTVDQILLQNKLAEETIEDELKKWSFETYNAFKAQVNKTTFSENSDVNGTIKEEFAGFLDEVNTVVKKSAEIELLKEKVSAEIERHIKKHYYFESKLVDLPVINTQQDPEYNKLKQAGVRFGYGVFGFSKDVFHHGLYSSVRFNFKEVDKSSKNPYEGFWDVQRRASISVGVLLSSLNYKGVPLEDVNMGVKPTIALGYDLTRKITLEAGALGYYFPSGRGIEAEYSNFRGAWFVGLSFDTNIVESLINK